MAIIAAPVRNQEDRSNNVSQPSAATEGSIDLSTPAIENRLATLSNFREAEKAFERFAYGDGVYEPPAMKSGLEHYVAQARMMFGAN